MEPVIEADLDDHAGPSNARRASADDRRELVGAAGGGLLDQHVLARADRRQCDRRELVVRRRDDDGVHVGPANYRPPVVPGRATRCCDANCWRGRGWNRRRRRPCATAECFRPLVADQTASDDRDVHVERQDSGAPTPFHALATKNFATPEYLQRISSAAQLQWPRRARLGQRQWVSASCGAGVSVSRTRAVLAQAWAATSRRSPDASTLLCFPHPGLAITVPPLMEAAANAKTRDARTTPPPPALVAASGWMVPGLGYWFVGQRGRGIVIGVTVVSLFVLGLLIGGVRVLEVPTFSRFGESVPAGRDRRRSTSGGRSRPSPGRSRRSWPARSRSPAGPPACGPRASRRARRPCPGGRIARPHQRDRRPLHRRGRDAEFAGDD